MISRFLDFYMLSSTFVTSVSLLVISYIVLACVLHLICAFRLFVVGLLFALIFEARQEI